MRRQHTAVLLACLSSVMGETGNGFAQSSPPTVAVLRATGDESARVTRMFLEALRGIGHEDGRTFRLVEYWPTTSSNGFRASRRGSWPTMPW